MESRGKKIVGEDRLQFQNNAELRSYYEAKYRESGYEEGGHRVHGVDVSAMYHAARLESALRLLAPTREEVVLDAGCGTGVLSRELAPRAKEVHAIDIAANAMAAECAARPNVHFRQMNLEQLEYPDRFFDAIACVETLEHLLAPEKGIAELSRVLKPGGRFVLTYPTINRTLAKRWRLSPVTPISEHLTEWSYAELVTITRGAGLEIEREEGLAFDFGALNGLKAVNRFFAESITRWSLKIRGFPANSMFVALRLRRR